MVLYNDDIIIDTMRERKMTMTETSCLTTFEAFGVARVLEKWIEWIDDWNEMEKKTADESFHSHQTNQQTNFGVENCKQLRAFMSKTFELTVQELRLSNTFTVLQQANDSILKEMSGERALEMEHKSNRDKLDVLRNGKRKYKRSHSVCNMYDD